MPGLHGQALVQERAPDGGRGVGFLVQADESGSGVAFLLCLPGFSLGPGLLILTLGSDVQRGRASVGG